MIGEPVLKSGPDGLPVLVWEPGGGWRSVSSAMLGGGIGPLDWMINMQVPDGYGRMDPDRHLLEVAERLGLTPPGVGLLTAARVGDMVRVVDGGVLVAATVGIGRPTWAAGGPVDHPPECPEAGPPAHRPGTINILVAVPAPLTDAALAGALITVTEAKTQGLLDAGVSCSGTASDAVCVAAREPTADDHGEPFAGPRSEWGSRIGRAVHAATYAGARRWFERLAEHAM